MEYDEPLENEEQSGRPDSSLPLAVGGLKAWHVVYVIVGIALVISLIFFWMMDETKKEDTASVPAIEWIKIVSRLEGENTATDGHKIISDGRGLMLYLVAYGYDKTDDSWYYYTDAPPGYDLPRIEIDGELISESLVRRFDFFEIFSLVYWYKWELSPTFALDRTLPVEKKDYRTRARRHRMGKKWWALADVRNDLIRANFEYSGTVHFTASLQVFPKSDPDLLYADLDTEGAEPEEFGQYPPNYHRVTRIPAYRQGLNATYRAFFNLFAYENAGDRDPMQETLNYQGGDSKSILIGAMRLAGIEADYDDSAFLERNAEKIFEGVTLDEFGFFRPQGQESAIIPMGVNGIQLGDILVLGDRYMVFAKNNREDEPAIGALTSDDLVLDAYNGIVRPRDLKQVMAGSGTGALQIWRLRDETLYPVNYSAD